MGVAADYKASTRNATRTESRAARARGKSWRNTSSLPTKPPIVPMGMPGSPLTVFALAMTIGPHLPSAIPRSDETICVGGGGVAKNIGVVSRINSVQAAWHHRPVAIVIAVFAITSRRRSGAEDAQGGGNCKPDESHLSTHGGFLLLPDVDT